MLQLYCDDSTRKGKVFILAGYISTVEKWEIFTDRWAELLTLRPKWSRFKASEIYRYPGHDAVFRVKTHYCLIREFALGEVCFAISLPDFYEVCDDLNFPAKARNPYFFAFYQLLRMMFVQLPLLDKSWQQPIEIFFDEQSERPTAMMAWGDFYSLSTRKARKIFKSPPSFKKDDDCMPLQAADLIAWHKGDEFERTGSISNTRPFPDWINQSSQPLSCFHCLADKSFIRGVFLDAFDRSRFINPFHVRMISRPGSLSGLPYRNQEFLTFPRLSEILSPAKQIV